MLAEEFDRAFAAILIDDVVIFELHSGFRVMAFDRLELQIVDGVISYVEDDGEESYFDASTVSRIIRRTRPPMSDRLRPSTNGKH